MNIWKWIKLAFAPKPEAINCALEAEIANLKAHKALQEKRRNDALEDAAEAKARKKKSSPYQAIAERAQANVLAYELELAELEKRRG